MSKTAPGLSDWRVVLNAPGPVINTRAADVKAAAGVVIFSDLEDHPVLMIPICIIQQVRKTEPREDRAKTLDSATIDRITDQVTQRLLHRGTVITAASAAEPLPAGVGVTDV